MEIKKLNAAFKNENDDLIFKKLYQYDTSILEIIKVQENELWVELAISDIGLLENIELMAIDEGTVRFTYNYGLESIIFDGDNEENYKLVDKIKSNLWINEREIQTIFGYDELGVFWGGPDTQKCVYNLGITYYIDKDMSWLYVEMSVKLNEISELITLKDLISKATEMANVLNSIINTINSSKS